MRINWGPSEFLMWITVIVVIFFWCCANASCQEIVWRETYHWQPVTVWHTHRVVEPVRVIQPLRYEPVRFLPAVPVYQPRPYIYVPPKRYATPIRDFCFGAS